MQPTSATDQADSSNTVAVCDHGVCKLKECFVFLERAAAFIVARFLSVPVVNESVRRW